MIDLDSQATTPLAPEALEAMLPWLEGNHANPHSAHRAGRAARAALEAARAEVAALAGVAPEAVIFTSGATEANNLAVKGLMATLPADHSLVTFATEHSCVREAAFALERDGRRLVLLGVTTDGMPDLEAYEAALADGPVGLVSAMLVNNEIGSIWPIARMAQMARAAGAHFHCDAAQGFGKIPVRVGDELGGAALVSVSAHKMYGPKGIGALIAEPGLALRPLLDGGGQERARSGTQSPALAAGFGAAARLARARMEADLAHARALLALVLGRLEASGIDFSVNGPPPGSAARIPTNLNLRFPGVSATRLIAALPDLLLTSGSACASASGRPSHVLAALGLSRPAIAESLRLGWGRTTTADDIERGIAALAREVARRQRPAA